MYNGPRRSCVRNCTAQEAMNMNDRKSKTDTTQDKRGNMQKIKLEKNSVQETLIIPLYARKKCSDKFPQLYTDPMASAICERIDYDFSLLERQYESTAYEFGAMECALRQMDMMWEINDYLKEYPDAAIVCMGCGLDFDPRRCGGVTNTIYNLDFPDVIAAREELADTDTREVNIACDLTDLSWMDRVDGKRGAVFYAAGVFHYLKTEDVKRIALAIVERFPTARVVFDTVGKMGYKLMMKVALKKHGINDFGELFYTGNPVKDLSAWSDKLRVSARGYMLGYYDMKTPGVRAIHRLLAKLGDSVMKMKIVRLEC